MQDAPAFSDGFASEALMDLKGLIVHKLETGPQVLWPLVRFPLRWPFSRPSLSRTFFSYQGDFLTLCTLLFCVKFQPFSPKAAHFAIEKHPKLQFSAQWNDRNLISRISPS